eukprot:gnl/MRDRNA2_/MRDRNA2_96270_c0_seq1.p1 gnl/MRDRNA2_/MRDRNA2_96270_c0~~gnl/MRDRNA2_/MRDRNA2_96270_c0_seq1.p1  ORF type:complete len:109 (-),score=21.82 gnl/MRDRNA2_/MRDRNA2_96270_c0_seq1:207-533(-)
MSSKYPVFVAMNVFVTVLMFVATMYITLETIRMNEANNGASMFGDALQKADQPQLCLESGCLADDLIEGPQGGECHVGAYTRSIAMAVVSFLGGGLLNARACKVVPPL